MNKQESSKAKSSEKAIINVIIWIISYLIVLIVQLTCSFDTSNQSDIFSILDWRILSTVMLSGLWFLPLSVNISKLSKKADMVGLYKLSQKAIIFLVLFFVFGIIGIIVELHK